MMHKVELNERMKLLMERIDKYQLLCMMMLFEIGSTTLFALGIKAKQDAWIVVIFSMLNGFALIWAYTKLQLYFPDNNFTEIIASLLGKRLGAPLSLLYGYYFIECSVLNYSEFAHLITMTILRNTSIKVILIVFMLIIIYYLFLGLEVISRTSEIMLPVVLFFLFSIYILSIGAGIIDLRNLTPVLGNGIQPILKASYPDVVVFPFGESVLFLLYWSYVNTKQDIRKTSFLALGLSGLIITCSIVFIISGLGVNYAGNASVPLLEIIKSIRIGNYIANLDVLATVLIFIGGFYKTLLNLLGGIIAISSVFKVKNKWTIMPVAILALCIAIYSIPSIMFHRFIGWNVFAKNIHVIFQVMIPVLLLIICCLKNKLKRKNTL